MWGQIQVIAWAQFRTIRNHLPRTSFGAFLMVVLSLLWYGLFATLGVGAGFVLSAIDGAQLERVLSNALLAALLFWQWMPLLTLSGGWSLQLNKLQTYPISTNAFFAIESALRLTTTPELVLLLLGAAIGLVCNPHVPVLAALFLLLYLPFNLFIALAVRELFLHSFQRNRFRELMAVLLVCVAVLPQLLLRTEAGKRLKPLWLRVADAAGTPWHEFASASSGHFSVRSIGLILVWLGLAYALARLQFEKALLEEEAPRLDAGSPAAKSRNSEANWAGWIGVLVRDPLGALIEKEIRSLLRMPRFRVIFGMACIFSIVVFLPIAFGQGGAKWIEQNFLPVVNLYGLLLLGDSLLWNIFGFDRSAAQTWYLTAVELRTVIKAKNMTAAAFIALQTTVVFGIALLFRLPVSWFNILTAACATVVVTTYFLAIGNLSSTRVPRAIDPSQTLRKQAGAQLQLWLLGSALVMMVLVGFAFLARWAFASDWAMTGVFAVEFAIGAVVYRLALDSAVERGLRDRERILAALSKGGAPVAV